MMAALPAALDAGGPVLAWRIDANAFASAWDSGIGAERVGGRWNPVGLRAVYCAIDPSTGILELAVHRGFKVLDTAPHTLTCLVVTDATGARVVRPEELPDRAWLSGGTPLAKQQAYGATLLERHTFVILPSAVSKSSWNLVFAPARARGRYVRRSQERLVIDSRLSRTR